ncbi:VOC family protein [Devosia nitrariae]|uniref:Glyoxalase n=1 Tax=Devosia nitrariae TaxID=2071872 RepID=A0ABQ5W094_9HYPH|nr:VOC family protein [Devosia nitrariae]GLQ53284.1 glyoxalase [Devosia nitrariae]
MKPRINIVTVGVDDLARAFGFYRVLFGLPDEQISAGEDHVAFFLEGDLSLVLLERANLAETAGQGEAVRGTAQVVLSHNAENPAEVDAILDEAVRAGGAIHTPGTASEWGYAGYFEDTEGNLWEVLSGPDAG